MKYDSVSIIYIRKGWYIISKGAKRATRKFSYPEKAYHYAMGISDKVYVHNENGTVKFVTDNSKNKFNRQSIPMTKEDVCAPKQVLKIKQ